MLRCLAIASPGDAEIPISIDTSCTVEELKEKVAPQAWATFFSGWPCFLGGKGDFHSLIMGSEHL